MPRLYDFSSEKAMPVLQSYNNTSKPLSSKQGDKSKRNLNYKKSIIPKDSGSDSDDCLILENPQKGLLKPFKENDNFESYLTDDSKYQHKKNVIYGIYGKSHDKSKKEKRSTSSQHHHSSYIPSKELNGVNVEASDESST